MAKLLRAVSQLGWLARCVSVRFVHRLTAWSRRDKARPTLPLGFCSGLISYPSALPGHPRRYAVRGVFRDSHPHTACTYGVRLTTWSSSSAYVRLSPRYRGSSPKTEGLTVSGTNGRISYALRNLRTLFSFIDVSNIHSYKPL